MININTAVILSMEVLNLNIPVLDATIYSNRFLHKIYIILGVVNHDVLCFQLNIVVVVHINKVIFVWR